MFDTKAFKQAVLSKAMQGKLTQQLPEDGNSSDLLKSIDNEKQRLIDEGKIKKQKPLPDIDPDEIPFDIPDNWRWVRLNYILDVRDGTHSTPKYVDDGIPLITSKNIKDGEIVFDDTKYISKQESDKINERSKVDINDIIMPMIGTIGNPAINTSNKAFSIKNVALIKKNSFIDVKYIYFYILSIQDSLMKNSSGAVQSFISLTNIRNVLLPLPPLAEQQRIVSQIDKCFKLANSIDTEHELNRKFSTNMHTSLLNAAMQGKLTQQLPEDGNASDLLNSIKDEKQRLINDGKIKKQKPLPDIDPDEIPFKIPNNWQWVRIPEVSTFPEQKTVKSSDISGDTWVLDLKDIEKNTGKINHKNYNKDSKVKSNKVIFNKGDVLYNKLRPYLNKVIVAPDSGVATSELFVITPFDGINANYLSLVLRSPFFLSKINSDTYGTKMPRSGTKNFIKYLIPLPPFLEQQRIVSKLNSLFSKLNRI